MKTMFQKHRILESLDALNNAQTEQVLEYIKALSKAQDQIRQVKSKREAMAQIRQALRKDRTFQSAF